MKNLSLPFFGEEQERNRGARARFKLTVLEDLLERTMLPWRLDNGARRSFIALFTTTLVPFSSLRDSWRVLMVVAGVFDSNRVVFQCLRWLLSIKIILWAMEVGSLEPKTRNNITSSQNRNDFCAGWARDAIRKYRFSRVILREIYGEYPLWDWNWIVSPRQPLKKVIRIVDSWMLCKIVVFLPASLKIVCY